MKIFVTGATGFIGSHLARRLVRDGYEVTVFARETSSLKYLPKNRVKIVYGDIKDLGRLQDALIGFDAVYHNAALVSDWGIKEDFFQTNIEGTRNILQGIRDNKIKNLILTSTCSVLGEEDCKAIKNENSPYKPRINYFLSGLFESDMNHYRVSKMLAEKEAIEFCQKHNINLTVIRPVWVYGPREFGSGAFYFCKAVLNGLFMAPIGKNNRFHVVYVEDLVFAMTSVLKKNLSGINIFLIGNENPPLLKEYLGMYCKMLGRKMPYSLPRIFFQPAGFSSELIYKLLNIKKKPLFTRSRVNMLYCNNIYDVSRARRELDFVASTSLEKGIEKTVRWWRQNGFLK